MNNSLKAFGDSDLEMLKKMKAGDFFECDIKKPRNLAFHKKFFALINMVYQNQEIYNNIDTLRKELTKASGFYEEYINHKGIKCYEAKSISFAKMEQHEFEI
jgi:hypothetical protein